MLSDEQKKETEILNSIIAKSKRYLILLATIHDNKDILDPKKCDLMKSTLCTQLKDLVIELNGYN